MNTLDCTVVAVKEMQPKVIQNEKVIAVVMDRLDDMQEDLKYLRRHSRP